MTSVCNAVGLLILLKLYPVFTFLQQLVTKICELFTYALVLQCSPSTSSRQPQTIHVFADRRIGLLRHALRICVAHATPKFCSLSCFNGLYTEPFELVVEIVFHYCTTPSCHQINRFESPFPGSCFERLDDAFVLLISLIFLLSLENHHFCQMTVLTLGCIVFDDSC